MELQLIDGDYVPDGAGGFCRATGAEEALQRALFLLTAHRGSFPFLPQLGSELFRLPREKPAAWQRLAEQYVVQALEGEPDYTVRQVTVAADGAGGCHVAAFLDFKGQTLRVNVGVKE